MFARFALLVIHWPSGPNLYIRLDMVHRPWEPNLYIRLGNDKRSAWERGLPLCRSSGGIDEVLKRATSKRARRASPKTSLILY